MPAEARPTEKVRAVASAMPTSTNWRPAAARMAGVKPRPVGVAATTVMVEGSAAMRRLRYPVVTSLQERGDAPRVRPSRGPTLWKASGSSTAGPKPWPFSVWTCTSWGPDASRAASRAETSGATELPSST